MKAAWSPRQKVLKAFKDQYGHSPELLVSAPGRVNLIGEHTDYNEGFVLPVALRQANWIAISSIPDREVSLYSIDFQQSARVPLNQSLEKGKGWVEYLKGIIEIGRKEGLHLSGWPGMCLSLLDSPFPPLWDWH